MGRVREAQPENSSRDQILERIRAGLRTVVQEPAAIRSGRVIFEPIDNPLQRFQQECVANLMECALTADSAASARQLSEVLQSLPAGEAFVQDDPSLRRLIDLAATGRAIRWSSQGRPDEASQATVTLAEALIAQTGSILVTASCGGRGASVIAPCHIVYATKRNQLRFAPADRAAMVSVTYANCLYRRVHLPHAKPWWMLDRVAESPLAVEYIFPTLLLSGRS